MSKLTTDDAKREIETIAARNKQVDVRIEQIRETQQRLEDEIQKLTEHADNDQRYAATLAGEFGLVEDFNDEFGFYPEEVTD